MWSKAHPHQAKLNCNFPPAMPLGFYRAVTLGVAIENKSERRCRGLTFLPKSPLSEGSDGKCQKRNDNDTSYYHKICLCVMRQYIYT